MRRCQEIPAKLFANLEVPVSVMLLCLELEPDRATTLLTVLAALLGRFWS
jgi:hypothetical protein